jgi:hypothetical protein
MNDRDLWLKMGYGEAEVDKYLRQCEEDRQAFESWWAGLPAATQEQINGEIGIGLKQQIDREDCPVNFEDIAERTVYLRHGFQYPHGHAAPVRSEGSSE